MKRAHTPGPWTAVGKGGTATGGSTVHHPCFNGQINSAKGHPIVQQSCFLGIMGGSPREAEANALLIAAAPDLLEGSDGLLNALSMLPDVPALKKHIRKLEKAIQKATP